MALLIAILVGALLSFQHFVRRGIQGRLRLATDSLGEQYIPGGTDAKGKTTFTSRSTETQTGEGTDTVVTSTIAEGDQVLRETLRQEVHDDVGTSLFQ